MKEFRERELKKRSDLKARQTPEEGQPRRDAGQQVQARQEGEKCRAVGVVGGRLVDSSFSLRREPEAGVLDVR